jgi:hypothetical protein
VFHSLASAPAPAVHPNIQVGVTSEVVLGGGTPGTVMMVS